VQRDGVKERLSLLYNLFKQKCYIQLSALIENILDLFDTLFSKTRLCQELGGGFERCLAASNTTIPPQQFFTAGGRVLRPWPSLRKGDEF
jgi:hypothetical protein